MSYIAYILLNQAIMLCKKKKNGEGMNKNQSDIINIDDWWIMIIIIKNGLIFNSIYRCLHYYLKCPFTLETFSIKYVDIHTTVWGFLSKICHQEFQGRCHPCIGLPFHGNNVLEKAKDIVWSKF